LETRPKRDTQWEWEKEKEERTRKMSKGPLLLDPMILKKIR
jgi:hypothetical protein